MEYKPIAALPCHSLNVGSVASMIVFLQRESGEIPWHEGGKTDPWDLVEAAMGLNIAGCYDQAEKAFEWMLENQNSDGSWYSSYNNGIPDNRTRETHMAAYLATGVFQTWLIRRDRQLLEKLWPAVEKGIDYALSLQTQRGEIYWAKSPEGNVDPMALLTASSSIFMSLKCAFSIAELLDKSMPEWEKSFEMLGKSIQGAKYLYNISKSRFSMYWFYPVLSGAITGENAVRRIEKYWRKYVIEGQGVRCVSDRPWVTVAETCELVIALAAMGNRPLAEIVFSWILERTYEDGTFWCGYTFPDMTVWPEEKLSWTNAVVLIAADILYSVSPAAGLFKHSSWDGCRYKGLCR